VTTELAPGLPLDAVAEVLRRALDEDLGETGDITTLATIAADARATASLVSREAGVVAGLPIAAYVFATVSEGRLTVTFEASDGDRVTAGQTLATVTGPVRDLLTAERTALNLLGHLSGVATATRRWVDVIAGTDAQVRDTRKTIPGLRLLEKYAVRVGGGTNHRMSLSDAALVKDNHVASAGGVVAAFEAVRAAYPGVALEIEVDTVEQARDVIEAGADLVLLDNMAPDELREVVAFANGRAMLEASGGLKLENAAEVASTGVDYLAVGALTHSASVLDIGLDIGT
jgi:nicotinate-nucleotide pyrophosphorylase (carboxylating)